MFSQIWCEHSFRVASIIFARSIHPIISSISANLKLLSIYPLMFIPRLFHWSFLNICSKKNFSELVSPWRTTVSIMWLENKCISVFRCITFDKGFEYFVLVYRVKCFSVIHKNKISGLLYSIHFSINSLLTKR